MARGRNEDGGRAGGETDRQTQGSEPKQMAGSSLCAGHSCCVSDYFWPLEEALGDLNDHIRQQ